ISFTQIIFYSPLPLSPADMISCFGEGQFIIITIFYSLYSTTAMISMQVCKKNISNIFRPVSPYLKPIYYSFSSMQIDMPEEFLILLITPAGINQNHMSCCFNNEGPQCKINEVVFV